MPENAPSAGIPPEEPVTFNEVFQKELIRIARSRGARAVKTAKPARDSLIGLAFSGGGIRSATFNLGILQALAEKGLLRKFDYLSTVSGGGYIGSWLAALTQRLRTPSDFSPVEQALGNHTYEIGKPAEPAAIRWLRQYADYLTPQVGWLSPDTGAMVGTWLRNVILNFIVIVLFLLAIILLPWVLALFNSEVLLRYPAWTFSIGGFLIALATVAMGRNMLDFVPRGRHKKRNWLMELSVMLFFVAAWLVNDALWMWDDSLQNRLKYWVPGGAVFYTVTWLLTFVVSRRIAAGSGNSAQDKSEEKGNERIISRPTLAASAAIAGVLGGLLLHTYSRLLAKIPVNYGDNWVVVILGTVAVMLLMLLVAVLQLGFLGRGCVDLVREWWARAGGRLLLTSVAWLASFAVVVFGPLTVRILLNSQVGKGVNLSAWLAWIASSAGGVLAGKSPKTTGNTKATPAGSKTKFSELLKSPRVLEVIAKVAPYVFVVGLLVLLSTAVHIIAGVYFAPSLTRTLWNSSGKLNLIDIYDYYWAIQYSVQWYWVLVAAVGLAIVAVVMSLRVDVNDFSMHHFYRNRLVRCYLGASNPDRKPQPFTGFDPHDDVALAELKDDYPGLYPILNASLNVTHGGELGFQERKAKSFVFTPLYCGYEPSSESYSSSRGSYLPPRLGRKDKLGVKRGITLGTAMAISGAAASPNMGHYTSSATAFLMTLFDVRLGWWMGNPRKVKRWKSPGPWLGLTYLLSELLAHSDEGSNYVYLSDGGHFENLAIYELIKRRCRLIMACDCGADGNYTCKDLMSAIEKCRTDLGVDIKIAVSEIKPQAEQRCSQKNFTVADIHYGPGDVGKLIYVKCSLPVDDAKAPLENRLGAVTRSYAETHLDFPHQSTVDQWFDEVQFEAYRALGEYIGTMAAGEMSKQIDNALGIQSRTQTAAAAT